MTPIVRVVAALLLACALVLSAAILFAQSGSPAVGVEVASVVRNDSPQGAGHQQIGMRPGGTLVATNFPVRGLILVAFRLQASQLIGGPDWLRTERYDVLARSSTGEASINALSGVLRTVLTERFRLKTHPETRELPVYALVMDSPDRQPGPRLRRVASGCGAEQPDPKVLPRCSMTTPPGRITGSGVTMAMLAASIAPGFDRVLVDRTGMTGWFDVELEFAPDLAQSSAATPPVMTALREQLGIRVEPTVAPVEVTVIDAIERPSEN